MIDGDGFEPDVAALQDVGGQVQHGDVVGDDRREDNQKAARWPIPTSSCPLAARGKPVYKCFKQLFDTEISG